MTHFTGVDLPEELWGECRDPRTIEILPGAPAWGGGLGCRSGLHRACWSPGLEALPSVTRAPPAGGQGGGRTASMLGSGLFRCFVLPHLLPTDSSPAKGSENGHWDQGTTVEECRELLLGFGELFGAAEPIAMRAPRVLTVTCISQGAICPFQWMGFRACQGITEVSMLTQKFSVQWLSPEWAENQVQRAQNLPILI